MTDPATAVAERTVTPRHYLMCRPTHFEVIYEINPWMNTSVPVDSARVMEQWQTLHDTYLRLGHRVDVIEGVRGLPDMVYAANGATVVGGRALGVRFQHPQRREEAEHFNAWLRAHDFEVTPARAVNEGEGDFLMAGGAGTGRMLAARGFRSDPASHAELGAVTGLPVVSLELVDPRFYHLDTALTILGPDHIAYFPDAFSRPSRRILADLYPDAIQVAAADAEVLGLNAVSDGRNVVMAAQATGFAEQLTAAGYSPVPVDLSELLKGGGGIKCATLELRPAVESPHDHP